MLLQDVQASCWQHLAHLLLLLLLDPHINLPFIFPPSFGTCGRALMRLSRLTLVAPSSRRAGATRASRFLPLHLAVSPVS